MKYKKIDGAAMQHFIVHSRNALASINSDLIPAVSSLLFRPYQGDRMTRLPLAGLFLLTLSSASLAEDFRTLAPLPPAAEASLREEMRENLLLLSEVTNLVINGSITQAGEVAERGLGMSARGKHRSKPLDARPGPHMPKAMHDMGEMGHQTASDFARIAATGDREKTLKALPSLLNSCIGCHSAYRIR
jgi:hypothetical protein